jgi:hypothetical protein
MVLTLYSVHLVILATGVLRDRPGLLYLLMVTGAVGFALLWRRWFDQGPLERLVAVAAGGARRMTTRLLAARPPAAAGTTVTTRPVSPNVVRGAGQLLRPLAIAGVLALAFWAGAHSAVLPADSPESAVAAEDSAAEDADPAPDSAPVPPQAGVVPPPAAAAGPVTANIGRYCTLFDQVDDLDERYPDQPKIILAKAGPQLDEMAQVAPVQIHDAVITTIQDIRAGGGVPGVVGPDEAALDQAETVIDAFEEKKC